MKQSTRSSKPKEMPNAKAPATFKVFYIDKSLLTSEGSNLILERFYHPGKNDLAWFVTREDCYVMEVMEFSEPRRSWLINSDVCSNGKIYMTTPIDVTFLVLHQLRKYCTNRAMELETIHDDADPSVKRLMTNFITNASLKSIADVKTVGDMTFYKYNHIKALAWLGLKTKHLANALKNAGVHCGRYALSHNYMRSEKAAEEPVQDVDFLRMACEIIGGYLDVELHDEFVKYLNIPADAKTEVEDKDTKGKRKSLTSLKAAENKRIKVDKDDPSGDACGAADNLNSNLLDESVEEICLEISPESIKPLPLKERVLTTKEKKLANSAKGTRSIASFFKK